MSSLMLIPKMPPPLAGWIDHLPPRAPRVEMVAWYCFGGGRRIVEVVGGRTFVLDHCGAPAGTRCSCQREDHDPGDEDRRAP